MVILAAGQSGRLAAGAWLILTARVATSIPHVRAQIAGSTAGPRNPVSSLLATWAPSCSRLPPSESIAS